MPVALRMVFQVARAVSIPIIGIGGIETADGLQNEDALQLQAACTMRLDYSQVNPVCLPEALSPHLAARHAGKRLQAQRLAGFCQGLFMERADLTLLEGAGGWRVPISATEYMSTLVVQLKLPVILVVGMKLGCLNHAMLTAEAIVRDGLRIAGWVANTIDPAMQCRAENVDTLREELPFPLLADIPRLPSPADAKQASRFIDLSPLLS